jgi:hypothetical protein
MVCSKCGRELLVGEAFCPACGHPAGKSLASLAAQSIGRRSFARTISRLSLFWYLFAGLNLVLGAAGLIMIYTGTPGLAGPWEPWPHPPIWAWTVAGPVAWSLVITRAALAIAAGLGLKRLADWGRPVAMLAAVVAFAQFPIGLLLGAYTLAVLLGKRNAMLYRDLVG